MREVKGSEGEEEGREGYRKAEKVQHASMQHAAWQHASAACSSRQPQNVTHISTDLEQCPSQPSSSSSRQQAST